MPITFYGDPAAHDRAERNVMERARDAEASHAQGADALDVLRAAGFFSLYAERQTLRARLRRLLQARDA